MKRGLLCLALFLGLAFLNPSVAWASVVHDAWYFWQDGGTVVDEDKPVDLDKYDVGDPTGGDIIQIWEKVSEVEEGVGQFRWTVTNDAFDDIYSFHVGNIGVIPISHSEPSGWDFDYDEDHFEWETDSDPLVKLTEDDTGLFYVTVPTTLWAISTGAVNDEYGELYDEDGDWVVSHPAPEPVSTLLFGLGLVGFGAGTVRRRFRA